MKAEMPAETQQAVQKKRRAPPHAFKPGQSGNPKGRLPRTEVERRQEAVYRVARNIAITDIAEALRGGIPEAANALIQIAADEGIEPSARIAAATALMDRVYGKPLASAQIATIDLTPQMNRAEMQRRLEALQRGLDPEVIEMMS